MTGVPIEPVEAGMPNPWGLFQEAAGGVIG